MNLSLKEEYQATADILQEEKLLIGLSYQGGIILGVAIFIHIHEPTHYPPYLDKS